MVELKELFERRDAAFKKMSDGIMRSIPNVFGAAEQFIRQREGSTGALSWEDINYYDNEDYIMIIGVLAYEPGDVITLPNGMEFEVTEQTVEHFKRLLRLGIPYKLAATGSQDDVFDFLIQSAEEADAEESLEEQMVQLPVSDVDNTEFNLDDLTDEQREQLRLFALTSGGNN